MKKTLSLLLVCALLLSLCGCVEKAQGTVTSMRFADAVSLDTIQKLNGKTVSIVGYMATLSPISGEYIYLMNMPFQSCPFCVPNTTQLSNTMAVYAKKGETFAYTDQAIRVTGTMQVSDYTDDFGYEYNYRVSDASYEVIDLSTVSGEYALWQTIASDGIVAEVNAMLDYVYFVCCWPEYTFEYTDENDQTSEVNMYAGDAERYLADEGPYGYAKYAAQDYFPALARRARAISKTGLDDLIAVIEKAKEVEQAARADLENGAYAYHEDSDSFTLDNADALYEAWYAVYSDFSSWLAKWEV